MPKKLTDAIVKALPSPAGGNRITYDTEVKGFGGRVTAHGGRAFILNYRTRSGLERRYTIGSYPDWSAVAARTEAKELKKGIDRGEDPLAAIQAERAAPTVADLCRRFEEEHLPKIRPSTRAGYEAQIANNILPALKHLKVADVTYSHIDALHRKITRRGTTYTANRTLAILSKMFSLAIKWQWRADNPAKGIERNQEVHRHRYLSADELARLTKALDEHRDQQAANIIRLLLLTGARRGEVLAARWDDLDLMAGIWVKPAGSTKQRTEHRVPLSAPARQLLAELHEQMADDAEFVFPGRDGGHRVNVGGNWQALRKAADIADVRLHDLRHTYASILASSGKSLLVIGALLGHSQAATTSKYAHLLDDTLREATESVGAIITGRPSGEIGPIRKGGK